MLYYIPMNTEDVAKEVADATQTVALGIDPKSENSWWELARFVIIAVVIVVPIRLFIAQPFIVSGSSMVPTFHDKNYLIVDEISYRLSEPKRGDVVIFVYPDSNPKNKKKYFIKRIIGLPNETVDIKDGSITITSAEHKDGFVLEEPYVEKQAPGVTHFESKEGEYFVMGDNRNASSDSRTWGVLPRKNIVGRAWLRLWPISDINVFPGKYTQEE
jgi:signal peptidase I